MHRNECMYKWIYNKPFIHGWADREDIGIWMLCKHRWCDTVRRGAGGGGEEEGLAGRGGDEEGLAGRGASV